ncbi:MarR family winged helix-turn-helix transcriptional regulator [Pelagibius sp. Alg239-R121]|uniref:MarR family winged helix-turn-helix transcriptional regulator n=1 Tax=Pelagibius sp. Alg239-R121 TaxID=2993448 RepID=UPI0024A6353B|nr:MarR family transcriptional regulator [Pelagibius sp. Alg239-R121]
MKRRKVGIVEEIDPTDYLLDDQIGFILRVASQKHSTIFANLMLEELTPTRFAVLAKLFEKGPLPQNELGRQAAMDVATIKGVVDRLSARALIRTRPDPDDGRKHFVELTKKGEEAVRAAIPLGLQISKDTLKPLNTRERTTLIRLLRKLYKG